MSLAIEKFSRRPTVGIRSLGGPRPTSKDARGPSAQTRTSAIPVVYTEDLHRMPAVEMLVAEDHSPSHNTEASLIAVGKRCFGLYPEPCTDGLFHYFQATVSAIYDVEPKYLVAWCDGDLKHRQLHSIFITSSTRNPRHSATDPPTTASLKKRRVRDYEMEEGVSNLLYLRGSHAPVD